MSLSLTKTTNASASGTYTPNCLINGFFDLTCAGDLTINPPTNCADGQIFAIKIASGGSNRTITWDSSYLGGMYPGTLCEPGVYGVNAFMYYQGNSILLNTSPPVIQE